MAYDICKWNGEKRIKIANQMQVEDYLSKPNVTSITPEDKTVPGLEDELEGNSWEDTYKINRVDFSD